jgi:hypothetical protein
MITGTVTFLNVRQLRLAGGALCEDDGHDH